MDAYIVACFDDTGLDAARCSTESPVVGVGEAAFHLACLVAGGFSVITTLSRSVPAIEHNLTKYGLAARCRRVRAVEVPVLELELPSSNARERISNEIRKAVQEDRAEAIVLRLRRHGRFRFPANQGTRHPCARRRRLRGQAVRGAGQPGAQDI
jgi:allantoin racemase